MKTKFLLTVVLLAGIHALISATTVRIYNEGNVFIPNEVTVQPGDTLNFDIGTFHNAVEVSQETWNAGDTASNGGFRLPLGGGEIVLTDEGTYYYVCQPHASLGMKGVIHVEVPNDIPDAESVEGSSLHIYPNPVSDELNLNFNVQNLSEVSIDILDSSGRSVGSLIRNNYSTGIYSETISVGTLEPGHYFISITTGSNMNTVPFIKL